MFKSSYISYKHVSEWNSFIDIEYKIYKRDLKKIIIRKYLHNNT